MSTRVQRDRRNTWATTLGAVLTLGTAGSLVLALITVKRLFLVVPIFALLVLGAGLVLVALGGAGTAACPACGHVSRGLPLTPTVEPFRCQGCATWLHGAQHVLRLVPDELIAPRPTFDLAIPPGAPLVLPPICAACGRKASKVEAVQTHVPHFVLSPIQVRGPLNQVALEVPKCDDHAGGGAELFFAMASSASSLRVRFQSFAFYRAVLAANRLSSLTP